MSARDRSRRRLLSADERVLWSTVTRSIAPLREAPPAVQDGEAAESVMPPAPAKRQDLTVSAPEPAPSPPPLSPLGRRLRARVARGKEAIDARLDLHGKTQSEAHAALLHFLRSAGARGARLVLVITGKGQRSAGEGGVLRRQVPHWLRLPEFRVFVIGFEDAHIAHGGEGALYVRLRRPRGE
jgi:DNA-nicking Smr family endonuclease